MPDIFWKIHTKSGTKYADSIVADWPALTIGERATIVVHFDPLGDLSLSGSDTHTVSAGDVEAYDSVTVADSATLTVNGELYVGDEQDRFAELEAFTDYAGQAAQGVGLNNVPWFREQLPADARVPSIVLGFEPAQALQDRGVRGFWGLLVGGRDRRNSVLSRHDLALECIVLADFGEYDSPGDVINDLEA